MTSVPAGRRNVLNLERGQRVRLVRALSYHRRRRNAELGRDPTQSITLRKNYATAHSKRFRSLKGPIRTLVQKRDIFGLATKRPGPRFQQDDPPNLPPRLVEKLRSMDIPPPTLFDFSRDDQKIDAFMSWLEGAEQRGILAIERNAAGEIVERAGWQQTYVQRGYLKGITHADVELARAGVKGIPESAIQAQVFQVPVHREALETLYTRNFRELNGITEAMDRQISRTLADGLTEGLNPRTMATRLNRQIDEIGITRARTMARTEIVRAHSTSTLRRYQQFGIKEVAGKAEFSTAGDDRVCPICVGLEGEVFELKEAEGVIPVHPNCRCAWLPVVPAGQTVSVPGVRLPG